MKLYPKPNTPGDATGSNNYRDVILSSSNSLQFDFKVDQQFTQKSSLSVRYSSIFGSGSTPTVFGDGEFNDGLAYTTQSITTASTTLTCQPQKRSGPRLLVWIECRSRLIRTIPARRL